MHILEKLAPLGKSTSPRSVPIGEEGVAFVSELRSYHQGERSVVVALNDPAVSSGRGGHCRIWVSDGDVWVVDEGSDNGTWVCRADSRFRAGSFRSPTLLHVGDVLRVGRHQYRLTQVDTDTPAAEVAASGAHEP